MPWFIRAGCVQCGTKEKRNWHPKSARCQCIRTCWVIVKRLLKARWHCDTDRDTRRMVGNEQMAAGICVQSRYELVDVRAGGFGCHYYCNGHGKLPGNKGGNCKPCEIATNRVIKK